MLDQIVNVCSVVLIMLGSFLLVSGSVGLLRFPDFYTRMHAAGITDTLAAIFIIFGLMLISGWNLNILKLSMILLFILFTGPTANHALAKAAQHGGLHPKIVSNGDKSSNS